MVERFLQISEILDAIGEDIVHYLMSPGGIKKLNKLAMRN